GGAPRRAAAPRIRAVEARVHRCGDGFPGATRRLDGDGGRAQRDAAATGPDTPRRGRLDEAPARGGAEVDPALAGRGARGSVSQVIRKHEAPASGSVPEAGARPSGPGRARTCDRRIMSPLL